VAVRALTTPYNQCDNITGTCLRDRQLVAIAALQIASIALAALSIGATFGSLRRPLPAKLVIGAVIAAAVVSVHTRTATGTRLQVAGFARGRRGHSAGEPYWQKCRALHGFVEAIGSCASTGCV
jgi:hypothetical protein